MYANKRIAKTIHFEKVIKINQHCNKLLPNF